MIPIIELRGAIPIGVITFHLSYFEAFIISFIGNILPVYFIVKFIRPIFDLLGKIKILKKIIDWATEKATKKISESEKLKKATLLGVFLFVAIPVPGTGAWMGSLIANFLDLEAKKAVPVIVAGVFTAGIIMLGLTAIANGGINILFSRG
ncbi:MAG: small multi-drug export protein [Clostridia bacterium]|nr:small multi-drug export protein [Clostridia bacterium]